MKFPARLMYQFFYEINLGVGEILAKSRVDNVFDVIFNLILYCISIGRRGGLEMTKSSFVPAINEGTETYKCEYKDREINATKFLLSPSFSVNKPLQKLPVGVLPN